MGLQVVGAGLGRTGTMSLKLALEQLLDGRCYHMFETFSRPDDGPVWVAASQGEMPDWNAFLAEYDATVDWPACDFWQRDVGREPGRARAALGARERRRVVEERQRDDLPGAAPHAGAERRGPLAGRLLQLRGSPRSSTRTRRRRTTTSTTRRCARPRGPTAWSSTSPAAGGSRCATALGVPVPDAPFPHTNTTEEFQQRLAG